jgi:hypothetical protein
VKLQKKECTSATMRLNRFRVDFQPIGIAAAPPFFSKIPLLMEIESLEIQ